MCYILYMVKINNNTYNILRRAQNPTMAEKDYLECVVLEKLFDNGYFCDKFLFAGGATLSKAYQLSMRIGQDIDLVYTGFTDLPDDHSRKQLEKFKKRFKANVFDELKAKINETINQDHDFLILTDADWIGLKNPENFLTSPTLHLMYKSEFCANLGHMCLEIIPRKYSDDAIECRAVVPYSIGQTMGQIPTVRYENTFWDKVYALHSNAMATRPHSNQFFSRHYYDVAVLSDSQKIDFTKTKDKLFEIERHQAKYTLKNLTPLGTPASVQLLPDQDTLDKLGADYTQMSDRFLALRDDWSNIVQKLQILNSKLKTI